MIAQAAFGMDCQYQCSLELWGSRGRITTGRIYTAPAGYIPTAVIETGSESVTVELPGDDHFVKSISMFLKALEDENIRKNMAAALVRQSAFVEEVRK